MNVLNNVITYVRRIIKSPSNASITDDLIIDYINRFWINDVDARIQLFDLKKKYQFITQPGVDQYNMPLYDIQTESGSQSINFYPVYQGFLGPAFIDGVQVSFQTEQRYFLQNFPTIMPFSQVIGTGNGGSTYTLNIPAGLGNPAPLNPPFSCILRGHVDISGVIATGVNQDPPLVSAADILANDPFIQDIPVTSVFPAVYFTSIGADGSNIVISDSGQFLQNNQNYGLLMQPGNAPNGNLPLGPASTPGNPSYSTTRNTINYFTGVAQNVTFPKAIPSGVNIYATYSIYQTGLPRMVLFYNNIITLRVPPAQQYLVELDGYLSPAAFLNGSDAIQFGYMSEYIARGAARKILSDTGDMEQMQFYEPLFIEQEQLVWKRSQRQWTSTRTQTLYSQGSQQWGIGNGGMGGNSI
jgi:hypothetical protein